MAREDIRREAERFRRGEAGIADVQAAVARPEPAPAPTPPPPTATPPAPVPETHRDRQYGEVVDEGTVNERFPVWLTKGYEVGDTTSATFKNKGIESPSQEYRVLSKEKADGGLWRYEMQSTHIFPGYTPPSQEEEGQQVLDFQPWWDNIGRPSSPDVYTQGASAPPLDMHGTSDDQVLALIGLNRIAESLKALGIHLEDNVPGAMEGYQQAMRDAGKEGNQKYPTLQPAESLVRAWNDFAEANPDDYTQKAGTEEGFSELMERAMSYYTTTSPPQAIDPHQFELGDLQDVLTQAEESYLPNVPFLKDAVIKATAFATDPIFIASVFAMPMLAPARAAQATRAATATGQAATLMGVSRLPGAAALPAAQASMPSRARLLAELSVGGAASEQAAVELNLEEYMGVPNEVFALPGMVAGPAVGKAAEGFTRGVMKSATDRARIQPVRGEPATETLVLNGEILEFPEWQRLLRMGGELESLPQRTLKTVEKADDLVYSAHYADEAEAVLRGQTREGTIWTSRSPGGVMNVGETDAQILAFRVRPGAKPKTTSKPGQPEAQSWAPEDLTPVSRMNLTEVFSEEVIGLAKPISRTPSSGVVGSEKGAPGTQGRKYTSQFDQQDWTHSLRPEADDVLRKLGRAMEHVPLVGQATKLINRNVVARSPELRGAFAFEGVTQYDRALRAGHMAPWKGTKPPFRQNHKAQFFIPDSIGSKQGKWIAHRDVIESVLKGESKYLKQLTSEQVAWMKRIPEVFEPFIKQYELLTGTKVPRGKGWFPSFVVDLPKKAWTVNAGPGKPSSLFHRVVEEAEEGITKLGIHYKPEVVSVIEQTVAGFQNVNRKIGFGQWLKRENVIREMEGPAGGPTSKEVFATPLVPTVEGVSPGIISIDSMNDIMKVIGPRTANPVVTVPEKLNGIARLMLTGVMDTGVGALQMTTLFFVSPTAWGEALGRGLYNAIVEPKQFYRFVAKSPAARKYIHYTGNVGLESEFMEATRMSLPSGIPEAARPAIDVGTWPLRTLISRMQTGFEAPLAYGRIFAFDAMSEMAANPGPLLRAAGARPLQGQAYHDEMFRLARFTDTLIGQPQLTGIIPKTQHQLESAYIWFATRYTRSLLGTAAYAFGKGYTPAQTRLIMSKMLLGGMAAQAGFVAAAGNIQGKSGEEIQKDIIRTLDPRSGKAYMSQKFGKDWYGLGGGYRSGFAALGTLGEADNWKMETWKERSLDNPFMRAWRSRTTPITGTLMDFMEGEDFIGREINFWDMVDHPSTAKVYAQDKALPFSLNAVLQEGAWQRKTARGIVEFFGLRTSPETAWEAMKPVMDRVATERFDMPFDDLEHNMPAQDLVRNHPSVKAVESGFGIPLLKSVDEKKWDTYRMLRDGIRDEFADEKQTLDQAFINGHITGKDYRDKYSDLGSSEFHKLLGSREALGETIGLDLESGKEPPVGTVDAALGDYYDIQVEDYTDKSTLQVDWDTFFADRDAAISQVPEEFETLVNDFISRHQGQIAKDFRKTFDQYIQPTGYFEMREKMTEEMGIPLAEIEQAVIDQFREDGQRAAPSDVGAVVEDYVDDLLEDKYGEGAPTIGDLKNMLRESNPRLDLELYRQGYASTVRSVAAMALAEELMKTQAPAGYTIPPLAKDVLRDIAKSSQ